MLQADMHVPYDEYLQLIEKAWTADFTPKEFHRINALWIPKGDCVLITLWLPCGGQKNSGFES